jgi:hypothetical protein
LGDVHLILAKPDNRRATLKWVTIDRVIRHIKKTLKLITSFHHK